MGRLLIEFHNFNFKSKYNLSLSLSHTHIFTLENASITFFFGIKMSNMNHHTNNIII